MEPFVLEASPAGPALFKLKAWEERTARLSAGFSSKMGGVSSAPYQSLNCAFHVNDRTQDVIQNRKLVADALSLPFEGWTCGEQVHQNRVFVVQEEHRGKGRLTRESAIQDTDALITNVPDVWLTSFYADCVPLFFLDPQNRAIGLAHAGWKGTVAEIAASTIAAMQEHYGSNPQELLTAIGPSIGACCYEVDDYVMQHVFALGLEPCENPGYTQLANGKYELDLKEINRQIMIKAGIMPTNIECSTWCTSCHEKNFFSHRRDQGTTGRMISWIALE